MSRLKLCSRNGWSKRFPLNETSSDESNNSSSRFSRVRFSPWTNVLVSPPLCMAIVVTLFRFLSSPVVSMSKKQTESSKLR